MDILLIESDARRRVMIARRLATADHRVSIASSIREAEEILHLVKNVADAPQAIIASQKLLGREGSTFRDEVAGRFPNMFWIPLRPDLDPDWLTVWLSNLAVRKTRRRRKRGAKSLEILLIEPDDGLRDAMSRRLSSSGDCVTACQSLDEAREFASDLAVKLRPLQAIVAPVVVEGADVIGFYLSLRQRFPKVRWIVTPARPAQLQARFLLSTRKALAAVKGLDRTGRSVAAVVRGTSSG